MLAKQGAPNSKLGGILVRKLIAVLLCLFVLAVPISAAAAASFPVQPFGTDVTPLGREELEEVKGEYKAIAAAGLFGAAFGAYDYLTTTPMEEWSWSALGLKALNAAISAAGGTWIGGFF